MRTTIQILFIVVLMTSCNKRNEFPIANSSNIRYSNKTGLYFRNVNNPFDTAGAIHNTILDYVINNYQNPRSATDTEKLSFVWEWFYANGDTFNSPIDSINTSNKILNNAIDTTWQTLHDTAFSNGFSGNFMKYLDSLEWIMQVDTTLITTTDSSTLSDIVTNYIQNTIDSIKSLEKSIPLNITDSMEMAILYTSCSIGRFSLAYWTNQTMDSNNLWGAPYANASGKLEQYPYPPDWLIRWIVSGNAEKDLIGALQGGSSAALVTFGSTWFMGEIS